MYYLNYESDSPYLNLALEEVLLEPYIKNSDAKLLFRSWYNQQKTVVIGRGEKINEQVHLSNTEKDSIPIIRRVSGGGTVLHGPDNLNLSFFLPFYHHHELKNLKSSYQVILSWVQSALRNSHQISSEINGSCDLVMNGKKISGTAQARKRHGLLHHMTLLLKADYEGMQKYLREPNKRPKYRNKRTHKDFVIGLKDAYPNFNLTYFLNELRAIIKAKETIALTPAQLSKARELCVKYRSQQWNHEGRFS